MSSAVVSECACTAHTLFSAHGARWLSHSAAFFAARQRKEPWLSLPKGVKARAPCAAHPLGSSTKGSRASLSPKVQFPTALQSTVSGTRVPVA